MRARVLQRKCNCGGSGASGGECAECKKKKMQRKAAGGAQPESAPPIVHEVLRSPGQPLDAATRAYMEPRFGHDFSKVRVHADGKAAESAQSVGALGYTVGRHVVFGAGQYAPHLGEGRKLLAHELTHVVQQASAREDVPGPIGISTESSPESEANSVAGSNQMGGMHPVQQTHSQAIQRQAGGGAGKSGQPAPQEARFSAEGVAVVVRNSCFPANFGFAKVEAGTRGALNAIFNTACIDESTRTGIQHNLKAHGLDIRCAASAHLQTPGACAESTGFGIPANIFTIGSKAFSGHPDFSAGCGSRLESTILHEIIHLTRGFAQEQLPASCEASCFGFGSADPALCRDIDVNGKRHATAT
jgi:hypothetical protein